MNSPLLRCDPPTSLLSIDGPLSIDRRPRRRRRAAAILSIAAIAVTGCGSSSDDAGDTAPPATDAPTPATEVPAAAPAPTDPPVAPTTTEPVATAPPATTPPTTEEVPVTVDPLVEARAAVEEIAGAYTGSWTNTTFGSTGSMVMNIALDGDEVVVDVDLGGNVFGQSDPDPENYRIPLSAVTGSGTIETAVFGAVTTTADDATGAITMLAEAVPAPGIATFESTVTPTGEGKFEGSYVVTFDNGDTAEGVFEYSRG